MGVFLKRRRQASVFVDKGISASGPRSSGATAEKSATACASSAAIRGAAIQAAMVRPFPWNPAWLADTVKAWGSGSQDQEKIRAIEPWDAVLAEYGR